MATRSLNKVILIGNLTRDPELKYTPNGTAVATFGVATNRSWTTSDGQTKEDTQFHRVVAWNKLAELCGKLLSKGRKIYLEGRITYRNFTGKDNVQRTVSEIVMDDFIVFSDGKRLTAEAQNDVSETPDESMNLNETTEIKPQEEKKENKKTQKKQNGEQPEEKLDDEDIPF